MRNFQGNSCINDCWLEMVSQMSINFGNIHSNFVSEVWVMKKVKIFSSDKYVQLIGQLTYLKPMLHLWRIHVTDLNQVIV